MQTPNQQAPSDGITVAELIVLSGLPFHGSAQKTRRKCRKQLSAQVATLQRELDRVNVVRLRGPRPGPGFHAAAEQGISTIRGACARCRACKGLGGTSGPT